MSEPSQSLTAFFAEGHRHCDDFWAEVESAAQAGLAHARGFSVEGARRRRLESELERLERRVEELKRELQRLDSEQR